MPVKSSHTFLTFLYSKRRYKQFKLDPNWSSLSESGVVSAKAGDFCVEYDIFAKRVICSLFWPAERSGQLTWPLSKIYAVMPCKK